MAAEARTLDGGGPARLRRPRRPLLAPGPSRLRTMIERARVELIPMTNLPVAVDALAPHSRVSMTCSPAKSIEATLDESAALVAGGHAVTPHISARMVRSPEHLAAIREQLVATDMREIFVVGGDADPPGCFFDAIECIGALIALDDADGSEQRQIDHIGYAAYPDGHPFISDAQLHAAIHAKQALIIDSGRTAHVTTQMCFSPDRIRTWLRTERVAGLTIPVHLGVPGVVEKSKLMTMGIRLGVGTSLRYLSKNRRALGTMMLQRSFSPDQLLRPLAADIDDGVGIEGIHLFTFNQVAATEAWRSKTLS